VQIQKFPVPGTGVNNFILNLDIQPGGKFHTPEDRHIPHGFVMVSGNINNFCAFGILARQLVENPVHRLRPVPALG